MKNRYFAVLMAFAFLFSARPSAAQAYNYPWPSDTLFSLENEYHAGFHWLDLTIYPDSSGISGNVMTRAYALPGCHLDTFACELDTTMTLDSARADLNGGAFSSATVVRRGTEIFVLLPFTVPSGQYTEVRMYYHGAPTASLALPNSGFFYGYPGEGGFMKFSASPPYNSYTWWPCKMVLTDKADSSWFFITTDTASVAASNGLLTAVTPAASGLHQYQWKSHHAIAFYLISFDVFPNTVSQSVQYFHPAGATDSMIIMYYNYAPATDTLIPSILQLYTKLFGPYPFYDEKYGIAGTNLSGGMENQTLVSMNNQGLAVEAHETAHQWWGDNVTCGSYQDIMVNEGFARWCESVYPEMTGGGDSVRIAYCNTWETDILAEPTSSGYSPADTQTAAGVYEDQPLYYNKNAMMLNTLRFTINNDSLFFAGLRNYQNTYRTKSGYGSLLRDAVENIAGIDLTAFFNEWYYGFGFPTYNITYNQPGNVLKLQINETTSDPGTPLFTTPLEIKIHVTTGDTIVRLNIGSSLSFFDIPLSGTATGFVVDPYQWLPNGQGTVTYDSSLTAIPQVIAPGLYTIYPNPASDYLDISSSSQTPGPVDVILYNALGQVVYTVSSPANGRISLPELPDGIYMLHIDHMQTVKVVIEK